MKLSILGAAAVMCAAVLPSVPACAEVDNLLSGTVQFGYANFGTPEQRTNDWQALGSVLVTFDDPGFNVQANVSTDQVNQGPVTITNTGKKQSVKRITNFNDSDWKYGGDLFWRDWAGDFGFNFTDDRGSLDTTGHRVITPTGGTAGKPIKIERASDTNFENVGAFGEWFVSREFTFRGKGGWEFGDNDGYYAGGAFVYYPFRQVAMSAGADYSRLRQSERVEDATASIEFLPVPAIPVSMTFAYTYARYRNVAGAGSQNDNIFSFTLKAYFNTNGTSLREYQRSGPTNWDGPPPSLIGFTFP